jgi:hypothetical protein
MPNAEWRMPNAECRLAGAYCARSSLTVGIQHSFSIRD